MPAGPPQPRHVYQRRRLGALGLLVAVIVVIAAATSSAGHHQRAARATPAKAHPSTAGVDQTVAAREQRAVASVLGYTSYISSGTPRQREVALTFDDGPGPFTPQVLSVLEREHVPATFFVVGHSLIDFGTFLPREIADGFVIGDHTQDHVLLSRLPPAGQEQQINRLALAVQSYQAPFPRLFRPPYGGFDSNTLALLRRYGMLMVLWSVDTRDYLQPGVPTIVQRAVAGAQPGSIILMHDAGGPRAQTIAALPLIIAGLRRRHLHLVTVPRLLLDNPPDPAQPPPRSLSGLAG